MPKRVNLRSDTIAAAGMAISVLFFLLCILILPSGADDQSPGFIIEAVREYGFQASNNQRIAYLANFILVAALSALGALCDARRVVDRVGPAPTMRLGMTASIFLCCFVVGAYSLVLPPVLVLVTTIMIFCYIIFVLFAGRLQRNAINIAAFAALSIYALFLVLSGFFARPIPLLVADPNALAQFEMHLAWLTTPGSAIAAGQNLFSDVDAYGVLWPAVLSVIDHAFGRLSIGDQLRFVQLTQALFCLCAVSAYINYKPRSYMSVLFAMLLAAPYWSTGGLGIWHANQTGFRSLGFPLGFLVLSLISRAQLRTASVWLGVVLAVAFLINIETAVALGIGYLVYLALRTRSIPIIFSLRMALAGLTVIVIFICAYFLLLGRMPIDFYKFNPFYLLGRFTTGSYGLHLFAAGYEGENYFIVPLGLLILAHSTFVTLRAFLNVGVSPLGHREAFRAAVSATLLAWLSYYFNAPNWWQIWTHLFLYGFLVLDFFDARLAGVGKTNSSLNLGVRWKTAQIEVGRLSVILLIAIAIPFTNSLLVQQTKDFVRPLWLHSESKTVIVSGILMPENLGDALLRKAEELQTQNDDAKGNLIYLTYNVAFMPAVTGLFEPEPYRNLWTVDGEMAFQAAMVRVLSRKFVTILIDAPLGPLAISGERAIYQNRWRAIIASDYNKVGTAGGWEIWRLRN